jgi:hypothetical protein
VKNTTKAVVTVSLVGMLVTTAIAVPVFGPDRAECKTAVTQLVVQSVDTGREMSDKEARRMLWWPCRFTTEKQVQAIASEVFSESMGLIISKAMTDMFGGGTPDEPHR